MKKTKKKHVIEAWVWNGRGISRLLHFDGHPRSIAALVADKYIFKTPFDSPDGGKKIRITIEEV